VLKLYKGENLSGGSGLLGNPLRRSGFLLVDVTDGECSKSLHKTGSVVASRSVGKCEHSLGKLSVELGLGVAQGGFNVNKLLEVVEGSVHLKSLAVLSEILLRSVGELDSGGRGRKLGGSRCPLDRGALVEEVCGGEVSYTLLLDASDLKGLLVLLVEVGGENIDDHITKHLLGVNEGIEVGLSGLNGGHNGFKRVATLFHITLDLPVELDIGGDIEVEGEVKKFTDTGVVHGVKTLEDDNRSGLNGLRGVKSSIDVVVDGLTNGLSALEGLDLFVHEIEVVLKGVEGGKTGLLASITVVEMEVIKADNSGEVGNQSVSLPSSVVMSTSKRSNNISSEDGGETAHESGLSATGISGDTNHDGELSILQGHVEAAGRGWSGNIAGHEGRRGEGGGRAQRSKSESKLHDESLDVNL
jgi:hypothetical protein